MALLDHEKDSGLVATAQSAQLWRARLPGYLTGSLHWLRPGNDNSGSHHLPIELDCLRGYLPADLLHAAARRGRVLGIGADRVLLQWGAISEAAYLHHLAARLGLRTTDLSGQHDRLALIPSRIADAAATGIVPAWRDGRLIFVIAPQCHGARGLARLTMTNPALAGRLELATTRQFDRFLIRQGGNHLARRAANRLRDTAPGLSAAPRSDPQTWWRSLTRTAKIAGFAALMTQPVLLADRVLASALAVLFLGFAALRLLGSLARPPTAPASPRRDEASLPVYSVVIALYREASSVAPLMHAIEALDYPAEKLDIILVIESDDRATRHAIERLAPRPHIRIFVAPAIGPRTKPKALNYALPFARGSLTAVFDAEDRPDPGQLRAALAALDTSDDRIACAQAALCIDNPSASLLSRMFAAEYAGQFDAFLPGLAALGLPLPLGGSSNHFRTDILRKVGAWDAYNVTEDADLGFRLARFGYRSVTIASTTYEEAPVNLGAWLRQRTRWMKGWLQTWSVHMRSPLRLWRETGTRGFLAINLIVGGNVLTALAYPALIAELLMLLVNHRQDWLASILFNSQMPLHLTAIGAGYVSTVVIGLLGLARRRQLRRGWILLLAPVYWGLLAIAAWRALWQLLRDPYRWEKTEHGLSPRSHALRYAQR